MTFVFPPVLFQEYVKDRGFAFLHGETYGDYIVYRLKDKLPNSISSYILQHKTNPEKIKQILKIIKIPYSHDERAKE